jgi:low temperature requirement protein LtrA
MSGQWLRAAIGDPEHRRCASRYAAGIVAVQAGWVGWLALPGPAKAAVFFMLASLELAVPIWAESAGRTSWHPAHIAERYGLFTLIVLGESVLAATVGAQSALDTHTSIGDLTTVIAGGLLIVFAMWWIYFDLPSDEIARSVREEFNARLSGAFRWGYGHFFVFAGAAATGAGLGIAVDQAGGHSALSDAQAGLAITVPVTVFLVSTWLVHRPYKPPSALNAFAVPVTATLVVAASWSGEPVLCTGLFLAVLVSLSTVASRNAPATSA